MYRPLIIKLNRRGHKKHAVYNIVVSSSDRSRKGGFIEIIGFINPQYSERRVYIDGHRLAIWVNRGAQIQPSVAKYIYLATTSFDININEKSKKPYII